MYVLDVSLRVISKYVDGTEYVQSVFQHAPVRSAKFLYQLVDSSVGRLVMPYPVILAVESDEQIGMRVDVLINVRVTDG